MSLRTPAQQKSYNQRSNGLLKKANDLAKIPHVKVAVYIWDGPVMKLHYQSHPGAMPKISHDQIGKSKDPSDFMTAKEKATQEKELLQNDQNTASLSEGDIGMAMTYPSPTASSGLDGRSAQNEEQYENWPDTTSMASYGETLFATAGHIHEVIDTDRMVPIPPETMSMFTKSEEEEAEMSVLQSIPEFGAAVGALDLISNTQNYQTSQQKQQFGSQRSAGVHQLRRPKAQYHS
ncbi:hypothetical protein F5884DRAFT_337255 [Xylogone sp. PMI_703]|nr:hypothetical protein F5884DRAFT_337255 [Xylogone sp. PMI_703]